MSGTQHTPGPWLIENGFSPRVYLVNSKHGAVGEIIFSDTRKWADARLIAAAPDLLEALDQINMAACYASEEATETREAVLLHIGALARAAIAKATGGAS